MEVLFWSWDIQFFIFETIPSTYKVVTSGLVSTHNVEYIFEYILWVGNHLFMKLGQIAADVSKMFKKNFVCFWWLGPRSFFIFIFFIFSWLEPLHFVIIGSIYHDGK